MPKESIEEQLTAVKLEAAQLELEELRAKVAERRAKIERQRMSHEAVESSINLYLRDKKNHQERCNHRKGGRGYEGIAGNGSDANYALIKHRMHDGEIIAICLRCQKVWRKGQPDYKEGMSFPTDNEMSESCQFTFTRNGQ